MDAIGISSLIGATNESNVDFLKHMQHSDPLQEFKNEMDELESIKNLDNVSTGVPEYRESVYDPQPNEESARQKHIDDVVRNLNETKPNDKTLMLEQIDMLRQVLQDDCVDISRVPEVTDDSDNADIQKVLKILELKNDRNRLSCLAEEGILLMAVGLEFLFDGEKDYFGFKPDLIGWSDTVKIKLRRLRFETSSLVGNIVQSNNISPGARLAIELIPSMFLYGRAKMMQKRCKETSLSNASFQKALSDLNRN